MISPSEPDQRGCQLSMRFSCLIEDVHQKLYHQGVIVNVNVVISVFVHMLVCLPSSSPYSMTQESQTS